jgi:hemerythrin
MDLVLWRDSYSVGNQRIDEQHKYLVKQINDLFHELGSKDGNNVKSIFGELFKYTLNHFSMEEKMMEDFKYSGINAHKTEHKNFIQRLNELNTKFNKGEHQVKLETLYFLKDWLLNHIHCIDKFTFEEINRSQQK